MRSRTNRAMGNFCNANAFLRGIFLTLSKTLLANIIESIFSYHTKTQNNHGNLWPLNLAIASFSGLY